MRARCLRADNVGLDDGSFGLERFCKPERFTTLLCRPDFARFVIFVAGLLLLPFDGLVAAPENKLIKPGRLMIDGLPVQCGAIPALISERSSDYGLARRGLIILNPLKLRHLSREAKLLIYYHECAHQYVGASELAADCWAIQKVRREGLIDRQGLKNACSFIKGLPANRRHPPGVMRCRQMTRCFNETYRRKVRNQRGQRPLRKLPRRGFSGMASGAHGQSTKLKSE